MRFSTYKSVTCFGEPKPSKDSGKGCCWGIVNLVERGTHELLVKHGTLILPEALHTDEMLLQLRRLDQCPG
jgi:hypothetical protein